MKLENFNLSGFGTTVGIARLSKSGGGSPVASSATEEREKKISKYKSFTEGWVLFVYCFTFIAIIAGKLLQRSTSNP